MGADEKDNPPWAVGPDGYPLDPNHPWNQPEEVQARLRQQHFEAAMVRLEARWRAGDSTAVAQAVWECDLARRWPPEWLARAVERLTVAAMTEEEKRARAEWDRHLERWEALTELRRRGHELSERLKDDRGTSWERARAAVGELLGVSDATARASYEIVEAAGGESATFETYKELLHRRRGKKC